jgi:hypothetical protein
VRIKQRTPVTVAHLRRPARRVNNVGEQHRGQHPIIGHVSLLASEELRDLLKRRTPRLNDVEEVAPRKLNVLRARDVISEVLAMSGWDERVVRVLDDEGRHADGRKQRAYLQFGHHRHHESNGPWARR